LSDWKSDWQEKTRGGYEVLHAAKIPDGRWLLAYRVGREDPNGCLLHVNGQMHWSCHGNLDLLPVPRPPKMRPMNHAELVKLAATPGLLIKTECGTIMNHI
jgi:hypothetical protein